MFALVLWSVALYGGTAAICLRAAHQWIARVRLRDALWLAALPLLFTGRATLTGGIYAPLDVEYYWEPLASHRLEWGITGLQTPLLSDVVYSMIPWQKAVRVAVKNGHLPLWNPFVLAGEPLLAVQQPAVLHPGTWIGFLLPLAQAWTFQMSLRLFVALLCSYLFLRDLGCRELPALVGSIGWAFSDFLIFWLGYPVNNTVGPFPLLLLSLGRIAKDGDRRAVAVTVVSLLLLVAAGHPETLLFTVTGAGVYFLFQLAWTGAGRRARAIRLSLLAGAISLGLSAVVLLPLAEAMPHTWEHAFRSAWFAHVKKSETLRQSAYRAVPTFLPHAYGLSGHGKVVPGYGTPGAYSGALVFPLAVAGLFSRRRARWALATLGALGGALAIHLAGVTDAVTALPLFDIGETYYLIFLGVFALVALAALGADRLCDGDGATAFLLGASGSALLITVLHSRYAPAMQQLDMPLAFLREKLWLELAPLALGSLAVVALRARPRLSQAAVSVLAVVLLASRVAEAGRIYPTFPSAAFFPHLPLLDAIPRGVPDRVVGIGHQFMPNIAAMYEVEDVRGYESMTFAPLCETFPLWSVPQLAWYNRVDSLDRPFLSFLNVRYAVVPPRYQPPASWRLLSQDPGGVRVFENTRVLSRAFVPLWTRAESNGPRRLELMAAISDFAERGVIGPPAGASAGEWVRNGRARVSIGTYRAQSMTLDVDAQEDAVIATSIPGWPGWKAKLDGVSVAPVSYNHAFLAFRVPMGRHRLELRFLSDGFLLGASLSLLSCVAAALAWRASRPRRRQVDGPVLSSPAPRS